MNRNKPRTRKGPKKSNGLKGNHMNISKTAAPK